MKLIKKIKSLKPFQIKCYNCFSKDEPIYSNIDEMEHAYCSYCDTEITEHIMNIKAPLMVD